MRHYAIWLEKYNLNREALQGHLKGYKEEIEPIKKALIEKKLIIPLPKADEPDINARMCFVDGGEGMKELLGAAVYFIRASSLLMDTREEVREQLFIRDLDMSLLEYDECLKERVELLRGMMEIDVAVKTIEEQNPEYVFLDGSLYVNFQRRPVDCPEYATYRKKFVRLLKLCKDKNIHLVGVSEDSHSRLFIQHLAAKHGLKIPRFMTDSSVLRLISKNTRYRTVQFTPVSKFEGGTSQNGSITATFPTIYLQPTEVSNPLRIDVPDWEKDFDKIIRLIMHLSKGSKQYGYPLPLFLAHLDAKIDQKHADWSTNQLIHYLSKNDPDLYETILKDRRRGARPGK